MKNLIALLLLTTAAFAQQVQMTGGVTITGNVTTSSPPQVITPPPPLNVSPAQLPSGQTGIAYGVNGLGVTISAGNGTPPYSCAVTAGTLPTGLSLSACVISGTPTAGGTSTFTITVTDAKAVTGSLAYSILINSSLTIVQTTLPGGVVSTAYSQTLTATGGSGSGYVFSLQSGAIPVGTTLVAGVLSGTPTVSGTFGFTILVTDSGANTASQLYSVAIVPQAVPSAADNRYCGPKDVPLPQSADGPVTLPLGNRCYYTPLSATPSPGTVRTTTAANFQATYNAAVCGDVINVTAGTSANGPWVLNKQCDVNHYITIQGSGISNGSFPAEGTRTDPCWSNTASLPNRPAWPCAGGPLSLTAKVIALLSNNAIQIKGASYHRIMGLEITRVTTPGQVYALVDLSNSTTQASHIIIDRNWMHGVNQDGNFPLTAATDTGTTRAVLLGQSNYVAVIDNYVSDIYNDGGTSANTDAQMISGGGGGIQNSGWGVYKVVNNHCEGSSEGCIIIGGSGGPQRSPAGCTFGVNCNLDVPTGIEVRRNLAFAPNSWNGNTTVIVSNGWPNRKNGVEFKSGANILLEANVFQNCWYSSQPYCYAFDFAPKNQMNSATDPGSCPSCLVQDAVARYNYSYNYPGAQIALYTTSFVGGCAGCGQTRGDRFSIHDNIVGDSVNKGSLGQTGFDCIEFLATAGPITSVSMRHNTCIGAFRSAIFLGATSIGQLDKFILQDNILALGGSGVIAATGAGCDKSGATFLTILNACVNGMTNTWTADHNGVFGTPSIAGWPSGNTKVAAIAAVGFTTVPGNNSSGFPDSGMTPADWVLSGGSTFHNAASDGSDVGANVSRVITEISGVASY